MAKVPAKSNGGGTPAAYDYGDTQGVGFEGTSRADYAVPFISLLQAMSPQLEQQDGLRAGMLFNTVTGEVTDGREGLEVIPCYTSHVFVEWRPREKGGGIVTQHAPSSEIVVAALSRAVRFGEYKTPDDNDLVETFYVYALVRGRSGGEWQQAVIAFSGSKIKRYKAWLAKARGIIIRLPDGRRINPPLFAHIYVMRSIKEKNNQGEFWNYDITYQGTDAATSRIAPNSEEYNLAREYHGFAIEGVVRIDEGAMKERASAGEAPRDTPF